MRPIDDFTELFDSKKLRMRSYLKRDITKKEELALFANCLRMGLGLRLMPLGMKHLSKRKEK